MRLRSVIPYSSCAEQLEFWFSLTTTPDHYESGQEAAKTDTEEIGSQAAFLDWLPRLADIRGHCRAPIRES